MTSLAFRGCLSQLRAPDWKIAQALTKDLKASKGTSLSLFRQATILIETRCEPHTLLESVDDGQQTVLGLLCNDHMKAAGAKIQGSKLPGRGRFQRVHHTGEHTTILAFVLRNRPHTDGPAVNGLCSQTTKPPPACGRASRWWTIFRIGSADSTKLISESFVIPVTAPAYSN